MSGMLLAYYGDDFSGSSDVLEVLAGAGVRTILFLKPPRPEQLARFPGLRAVGVAGLSRSLPTERMDDDLRPAFAALGKLAPLVHYKICSTFDSSPSVGSVGRAIDIGRKVFAPTYVPLVVGAPALGRFCVFGNLFARSGTGGSVHRLDRHPTMAHHPITPMDEADLTRLLARQSTARTGLLDWTRLDAESRDELLAAGSEVILFDAVSDAHLPAIGRLVWGDVAQGRTNFAVGSSGLEYALVAHWRETGLLPIAPPASEFRATDRIIAVSGSCSPITESQIEEAVRYGFGEVRLQPELWTAGNVHAVVNETLAILRNGQSVVVHAAAGPNDPRICQARSLLEAKQQTELRDELLGGTLAAVVNAAVQSVGVSRVAIAGGDTSGYVASLLGIEALEYIAPLAPGSPLCRAIAPATLCDGLEVTFKGGQVGKADFFVRVLSGASGAAAFNVRNSGTETQR